MKHTRILKRLWQCSSVCYLALLVVATFAAAAVDEPDWASYTKQDLAATRNILKSQTPGPYDKNNPAFSQWLEQGYQSAMARAEYVQSFSGYEFALRYYANGFHDKHIFIMPRANRNRDSVKWPGFTIVYRNNQFIVANSTPKAETIQQLPPVNAVLKTCEGQTPERLMRERVFPYYGYVGLPSDWIKYAPYLFIDENNPWALPLKQCIFATDNGEQILTLHWQRLARVKLQQMLDQAVYAYKPVFKIESFGKYGKWISLPTFRPRSERMIENLNRAVAEASHLEQYNPIVFDVRGNSGGNSIWGTHILQNLYGMKYYNWVRKNLPPQESQWRVSEANIKDMELSILPRLEQTVGKASAQYRYIVRVTQAMKQALKQGKPFVWVRANGKKKSNQVSKPPTNPVPHKVFIVADGRCGSSCLTFIEQAMLFSNVTLVGKITSADTQYTELKHRILPSGISILGFPTKLVYHRTRENNQPFVPDIIFPGDINDTQALQAWILRLNGS